MTEVPEYGPKMRVLTEKQRRFVMAMIENPGITQHKAAELAGYQNSPGGMRVLGHALAHDQRVLEAMHEVAGQQLRMNALLGSQVLIGLCASQDEQVRLKAAGMLLDRTGFGVQQNINVNQTVTDMSSKAILERIGQLAHKYGLDQQKLLTKPVIDAQFSEVGSADKSKPE